MRTSTCKHCGRPIRFVPYFYPDHEEKDTPRWMHTTGALTCSLPAKPPGLRFWPVATPVEAPGIGDR